MIERYFDNAATTPVDPRVLEEMLPFLSSSFGNASSSHQLGREAHAAVELARQRVAQCIGAEFPEEIIFTSGATEANNWVLKCFDRLAVGPFEHPSVRVVGELKEAQVLPHQGFEIGPCAGSPCVVSAMKVNNETGAIWHPETLKGDAEMLHSDITQAVGKVPCDLTHYDFASMSGHKIYGPKGVGALYVKGGPQILEAFICGGGQEYGARSGTLNVPGIVGLGAACQILSDEFEVGREHARHLRDIFLNEIRGVSDCFVNDHTEQSPFILSLTIRGVPGQCALSALDTAGYCVSSGSACSAKAASPSVVLTRLGLDAATIESTLRISFGRFNTEESAEGLARSINRATDGLRALAV